MSTGRARGQLPALQPSQIVQTVSLAECPAQIERRVTRAVDFEKRTWFIGDDVAARASDDPDGTAGLTCGRKLHMPPGEPVSPR